RKPSSRSCGRNLGSSWGDRGRLDRNERCRADHSRVFNFWRQQGISCSLNRSNHGKGMD
ncbi:unnamed protein product, partial [Scytosiphon promiscuus]